jgi:hypothetical protein
MSMMMCFYRHSFCGIQPNYILWDHGKIDHLFHTAYVMEWEFIHSWEHLYNCKGHQIISCLVYVGEDYRIYTVVPRFEGFYATVIYCCLQSWFDVVLSDTCFFYCKALLYSWITRNSNIFIGVKWAGTAHCKVACTCLVMYKVI